MVLVLGLAVIIAVYLLQVSRCIQYVVDDAYITFRYSRFLAMSQGPYFNVDQHVEGYTNFLLMLLLAPIIAIGGEGAAAPAAKAVGILSAIFSMFLAAAICRHLLHRNRGAFLQPELTGLLAAGLIAISTSYVLNSTSGLETTLFGFWLTLGVYLALTGAERGKWFGSGVAFAAGALTRPEGAVIFATYWLTQALRAAASAVMPADKRAHLAENGARGHSGIGKHLLLTAVLVVAVAGAHLIFRLVAYDGEWLPNTYYAKTGGLSDLSPLEYAARGTSLPFFGAIGFTIGCVGWLICGTMRSSLSVAMVSLVGCLLPLVTGADWMLGYRLIVPYLPLTAVIIAIGWAHVGTRLRRRPTWLGPGLALCILPVLWCVRSGEQNDLFEAVTLRAKSFATGHRGMAEWLRREAAKPGDTVALQDAGMVGYICIDQRILDTTGLTDRYIGKSPGGLMGKKYDISYVFNQRPAFIILVFCTPNVAPRPLSEADRPLPEGVDVGPYVEIDVAILEHPEFNRWYVHRKLSPRAFKDWTDAVAHRLGADRVFDHPLYREGAKVGLDHPQCGPHYLLVVFRRGESPL